MASPEVEPARPAEAPVPIAPAEGTEENPIRPFVSNADAANVLLHGYPRRPVYDFVDCDGVYGLPVKRQGTLFITLSQVPLLISLSTVKMLKREDVYLSICNHSARIYLYRPLKTGGSQLGDIYLATDFDGVLFSGDRDKKAEFKLYATSTEIAATFFRSFPHTDRLPLAW